MLKILCECLTVWSVPPTSLQGAQVILAHAAGENSPNDPGIVNKYNAELIRKLYQELKIPVIAQGSSSCVSPTFPMRCSAHDRLKQRQTI